MPISEVKCCDCMDFMAQFPDKFFDLAIVDPPYGIGITNSNRLATSRGMGGKSWDNHPPSPEYFKELKRVSKNRIIWGGNYFTEWPCKHFIVWDKQNDGRDFADCELASSSIGSVARIFRMRPMNMDGGKIHPTQKPVALYIWLLQNYAKPGDKILDTHMGSQSSRIAAWKMGFDYWGCEIDQEYFDQGCARFEKERRQLSLFAQPEEPEQEALF